MSSLYHDNGPSVNYQLQAVIMNCVYLQRNVPYYLQNIFCTMTTSQHMKKTRAQ